jgi:hypothetical protein
MDKFASLFLQTRFMGKLDEQQVVKTIAKKLLRELNANARNIKLS